MSALPASTGYGSSDASGAHWTSTRPQHWSTIRIVACRLLQHSLLLASAPKVVTDRLQRVMNAIQYSQVRPTCVAAPALRATLVRCTGKSSVQTRRRNVHVQLLFARPITAVPVSDVSARQHLRSATRVSWGFRDAGSAHSVHGPFLWPARRFGTLYQTA